MDTRVDAKVPPALLKRVVDYFNPVCVILFGSRARGEARPDSDYDLFVVLDDAAPAEKLSWRARSAARRGEGGAADVFPSRRSTFGRRGNLVGSLDYAAAHEGIVVYGDGIPAMSDPTPTDVRAEVRRWLVVTDRDIRAARHSLTDKPPQREIAAYHCQQAGEKLIKALLVARGVPFPKTHNLAELNTLAAPHFPSLAEDLAALEVSTAWGVAYRYPEASETPPPTTAELQDSLSRVEALRTEAEKFA
jgi:HEPN domain-containing protein